MPWFGFASMFLIEIMELTLFVLVVIVLIQLIKFLKLKNAALKVKAIKTNEETSPKHDSQ